MWRQPDHDAVITGRDATEETVARHADVTFRRFLRDITRTATASLGTPALVAAGTPPEPITLGAFQRFWAAALVRTPLEDAIRDAWLAGYRITSDRQITYTSHDALPVYMAATNDRLVRGLTPPVADDAFDIVRQIITRAAALGWSTPATAQRIANELRWETNAPYWRTQLASTDTRIDKILDPLGSPGTAVREHARLHDPTVRTLQADRAGIIRQLDAEASHWSVRATRIAATESTGAYGSASVYALSEEGVECKEWLATLDARTRPEHAAAHGQTRLLGHAFSIGGFAADHPADPALPARLSVHCRCCVVGGDCGPLVGGRATPGLIDSLV